MPRLAWVLIPTLALLAADDPWNKVRDLKSGTELRIFKKSAKLLVLARFDELTADNLVVVIKNEQTAIPRDEIDRIDSRPSGGSRITRESKTTVKGPGDPEARPGPPSAYPGQSTSTSTGLSIGGKPDFETVYRRPLPAPKK